MASNHKLTALLKGRTIAGTSNSGNVLTVSFSDGSQMTVQTTGSSNSAATGGTVADVRQDPTTLTLDFNSGSSLTILLAEEISSVMVRDKNHVMEYAD